MFSGVGNSTFAQDCAARRSRVLIFCQVDAETTPVLRTEGCYIPKVRQTSFLPPCTAHSFGCFQKNGGCISGDRRSPLRREIQKNMLPSHGIGTRANIRFVVPPKFKTDCLLWPPVTGREPWAFPPPLRRCPSSDPNGRLSALSPSLWIGGQSTAAASAR